MITNLYSIHDRLAETYSTPMPIMDKILERQLAYIISDMSRLDVQDKECCIVGSWDSESGQIIGRDPVAVIDLSSLKAKLEEKANG